MQSNCALVPTQPTSPYAYAGVGITTFGTTLQEKSPNDPPTVLAAVTTTRHGSQEIGNQPYSMVPEQSASCYTLDALSDHPAFRSGVKRHEKRPFERLVLTRPALPALALRRSSALPRAYQGCVDSQGDGYDASLSRDPSRVVLVYVGGSLQPRKRLPSSSKIALWAMS